MYFNIDLAYYDVLAGNTTLIQSSSICQRRAPPLPAHSGSCTGGLFAFPCRKDGWPNSLIESFLNPQIAERDARNPWCEKMYMKNTAWYEKRFSSQFNLYPIRSWPLTAVVVVISDHLNIWPVKPFETVPVIKGYKNKVIELILD